MPEASRSAVHQHRDLAGMSQAKDGRGRWIVDLFDALDLQEVVARPEGAQLVVTAGEGLFADSLGKGLRDRAGRLDPAGVFRTAESSSHRPPGAVAQNVSEFG